MREGNYYSLKGQHEKAVTYFLKALRLDRRCLSAWTLMGHEFVELKNSGAAIEAYRQAVGKESEGSLSVAVSFSVCHHLSGDVAIWVWNDKRDFDSAVPSSSEC